MPHSNSESGRTFNLENQTKGIIRVNLIFLSLEFLTLRRAPHPNSHPNFPLNSEYSSRKWHLYCTHHAPCTRAIKDQDYCTLFAMVWYNIPISLSLLFASGSLLIPSCHPFKCNLDPEKNTLNAALRLPRAHAMNCTVNIYPPLSPPQMRIYKYTSTGGFHLQPIHKRKHNSNKTDTHPRNLLPSIRTPLRT
jgi:hypothetical protein